MNWTNIRLIFQREVRDQLRDRRTLFMIAVLPVLLYPALMFLALYMSSLFKEQPRTVVILGKEHLPPPALLDGEKFVSNWFTRPDDAEKLNVIADGTEPADAKTAKLLEQARVIRQRVEERSLLEAELKKLKASGLHDAAASKNLAALKARLADFDHELAERFAASQFEVLIVIPEGFKDNVERVNRLIAERRTTRDADLSYARPTIVKNRADDKSVAAYDRVHDVLDAWEQEILRQRLQLAGLPEELPKPIGSAPLDLAGAAQFSANLSSKLFPALLVIMSVVGAFYPAVDLAAGEKERGTMETLLISPATRTEIVLGKFFTVMCFSVSNVLLNLLSMGTTGHYMLSARASAGAMSKIAVLSLPTPAAITWLLVLLIPLSALFSALCLALATFARSSKEGQYYLMPLLLVSMGLTISCMFPTVEIYPVHQESWFYSVMPVVGVALLLKALLLNPGNTEALIFAGPVLATSIVYSLLALWWAIEQFASEGVLFREGERFELGLWVRHLLREKEPTPSFSEAGFCFVLIMLAQFVSIRTFSESLAAVAREQLAVEMMKLLVIQQLALVACPVMVMGLILTTSVRQTFRLHWPNWKFLAIASLLPFVLHPLSLELVASLKWFFPKLPEGVTHLLEAMSDHSQPLWLVLFAFAVAPAVCEELAFRGFILTGFNRNGRPRLAIALSALTFGIMHMIPQQVFNATLLGLVLGLIAVRSGSLLPGIAFHVLFNALAVLRERLGADWAASLPADQKGPVANWFVTLDSSGLRYNWPTLVICAAVAGAALCWLVRQGNARALMPAGRGVLVKPRPVTSNVSMPTGAAAK